MPVPANLGPESPQRVKVVSQPSDAQSLGLSASSTESTVTLSHDFIGKGLEEAREGLTRDGDPTALRRALLELLRLLEGNG